MQSSVHSAGTSGYVSVDGKTILNCILKKWNMKLWSRVKRLKLGSYDGPLCTWLWTSRVRRNDGHIEADWLISCGVELLTCQLIQILKPWNQLLDGMILCHDLKCKNTEFLMLLVCAKENNKNVNMVATLSCIREYLVRTLGWLWTIMTGILRGFYVS